MSRDVLIPLPRPVMPKPGTATALGALIAAALASTPAWSAPPVYQIVKLPGIKGEPTQQASNAHSMNRNGDIVGYITRYVFLPKQTIQVSTGIIWPADGSAPIKLKNPQPQRPNDNVIPWGINNARSVAGNSIDYHGLNSFPELWIGRKAPVQLQSTGQGQALYINDANITVGYTQAVDGDFAYPVFWNADGTMNQFSTTPGAAVRISPSGAILGNLDPGGYKAPFIRDAAGNMRMLQDLPGQTPTYALYAWDFNDDHIAVGSCDALGANWNNQVACLWEADGTVRDLGRINDGHDQRGYTAWGINNARQVIGYYVYVTQPNNVNNAVPTWWTAEDGLHDLRTLIDPADPLLAEAYKPGFQVVHINDDGVIVGQLTGNTAIKLVPKQPTATKR